MKRIKGLLTPSSLLPVSFSPPVAHRLRARGFGHSLASILCDFEPATSALSSPVFRSSRLCFRVNTLYYRHAKATVVGQASSHGGVLVRVLGVFHHRHHPCISGRPSSRARDRYKDKTSCHCFFTRACRQSQLIRRLVDVAGLAGLPRRCHRAPRRKRLVCRSGAIDRSKSCCDVRDVHSH